VVIGGHHATVAPEEVMQIADIAVLGEGEETFAEILRRIDQGDDCSSIEGCWVRKAEDVVRNGMRALIPELDDLPMPNWDIFSEAHYRDSYTKNMFEGAEVVGVFERSRGCPFACTYCSNAYVRSLYKGKGRWRREKSPERVVGEISAFRDKFGLDAVYFIDEVVLTRKDSLARFRDLYRSEIGKPFTFMERPENMTDEKVRIIKEAGAHRVSIGIESGDERIRRNLLNRKMSQESIISAFETARTHGLSAHAFTMVGFPGETRESLKETYELLKKARPDSIQTSIFHPLEGTSLYNYTVEEGLFDPESGVPENYYQGSKLNFPDEWKEELQRWRYILTTYKSPFSGLFVLSLPRPVFRLLEVFRKTLVELRHNGLRSTLGKIIQHLAR
jgi:radical SAM superfamily enzyme YgiQ (UPF0313 family)